MAEDQLVLLPPAEYHKRRRLQATGLIAWSVCFLLAIFTLVLTVFSIRTHLPLQQTINSYLLDGILVVFVILFAVGGYSGVCKVAGTAESITIFAFNVSLIVFELMWAYPLGNGLDVIVLGTFSFSGVIIGVTGVLGDTWMAITSMVIINTITLVISITAPVSPLMTSLWYHERALLIPLLILEQWVIAAIILIVNGMYRRTVADVSLAYIQTKQLDEVKDLFITHVNHELRTPVMALHGYVEYIHTILPKVRAGTLPGSELDDSLKRASNTGHRLVSLLNSILDVRRIDSDTPFEHEEVNLRDSLDVALQMVDPREARLSEKQIYVDVPAYLAIWGEKMRMQQILTNILSNAIKYSPSHTPIEVNAAMITEIQPGYKTWHKRLPGHKHIQAERRYIEISVRDHGLGIPPDQQNLLFNRFARLPRDLASKVQGSGLGLYLCRVMTRAMNGQIWLESTGVEGEGTIVRLRFPAMSASQ